mmetsp:Transcript_51375/g.116742  ORF Transcript_51375/g.116742 Transcript_51375/m.116742 type:complete len:228 (-) Transcript_51375:832-1515(-)
MPRRSNAALLSAASLVYASCSCFLCSVAWATVESRSLMPAFKEEISSFKFLISSASESSLVSKVLILFASSLFSSSVLSISASQKAFFWSSSSCSFFREATILSTSSITFSKPPFLPCRAIRITSTLTERGSFRNCSLIFPRASLSLVRTCNRLGEGRVFLKSSKASSEFSSLMVSAIATSSWARVPLASSCSFAFVLQSSAKPDKKVSSAPFEVSVSLRSFFSTVI